MNQRILLFFVLISSALVSPAQQTPVFIGGDSAKIDYGSPKEYIIGSVTVTGTDFFDKNSIRLLSGLNEGDMVQVPGEKFSLAIKNLWEQSLFEDIKIIATKIAGGKIYLEIRVVEKPRLNGYTFRGTRKSEEDDIKEKLNLGRDPVLTDYIVSHIKQTTTEYYVDKGYMNVKVDPKLVNDSTRSNSRKMFIYVTKGKKIRIQNIIFHGNTQVKSSKLRRSFKETKQKRWYNIFNSGKYLESNFEKDIPKIPEKYLSKGFRDVEIVKDTVYQVSENRVNIEITIREGRKYYFRNITWVGNTKYSSKKLSEKLDIKKGDIYDQSVLESKLYMSTNGTDISSLYMDDGYLFFQVNPVEVLVQNDSIDIEMRMYEGKQATINKVIVNGNTKTNDHVIMREIRTKPGQLFRRSDIQRTIRELATLGYFNPETIQVNPNPNPATGTVDIEYVVEEKASDQIELSGGWGGGRVVGTLGLSFNNFSAKNFFKTDEWRPLPSGDGQRLSVRAQSYGLGYQSYNASFTEPWLGGKKPNSLSVSVYHSVFTNGLPKKITTTEGKVANPNRTSLKITGLGIGLGSRLQKPDDFFSMYHEFNYAYYELNQYPLFQDFSNGFANNFNYKFTISRNSIQAPPFERTGSNITFSAQLTPPYSLFSNKDYATLSSEEKYKFLEFHKYKLSFSWFNQLTHKVKKDNTGNGARNLVLHVKAGFGYLAYYNSKLGLSPIERYYLGGSGMTGFNQLDGREIIALRGYDDQSVTPTLPNTSRTIGGAIVNKYVMELRYPISLNPQATIFALAFAEAGNSWLKFKDVSPFGLKRSAGVGLRVFLPMFGLLGFDYGWRFDDVPSYPTMEKSQFHFTIGYALGDF